MVIEAHLQHFNRNCNWNSGNSGTLYTAWRLLIQEERWSADEFNQCLLYLLHNGSLAYTARHLINKKFARSKLARSKRLRTRANYTPPAAPPSDGLPDIPRASALRQRSVPELS